MSKRRRTKSERTRFREKLISFIVLLVVSVVWIIPLLYMTVHTPICSWEKAARGRAPMRLYGGNIFQDADC